MSGVGGIGGGAGGSIQQIMAMRQQILDRSNLLQAIHDPAGVAGAGAPAASPVANPAGGFTGALKSALDHVAASQNAADKVSAAYETGQETDVAKVMLAREQASMAFEATLQVRNKLLSAYQDIMRMGV